MWELPLVGLNLISKRGGEVVCWDLRAWGLQQKREVWNTFCEASSKEDKEMLCT